MLDNKQVWHAIMTINPSWWREYLLLIFHFSINIDIKTIKKRFSKRNKVVVNNGFSRSVSFQYYPSRCTNNILCIFNDYLMSYIYSIVVVRELAYSLILFIYVESAALYIETPLQKWIDSLFIAALP